jgi:hypothetical protein
MAQKIQHRWLRFKRHLQPTTRVRTRLAGGAAPITIHDTQELHTALRAPAVSGALR